MEPKGSRRAPSGRHRLGRGPAWEQARCPRGGTAELGFPGSVGKERLGRAECALTPPGRQAAGSWAGRGGQHGGPATQRPRWTGGSWKPGLGRGLLECPCGEAWLEPGGC